MKLLKKVIVAVLSAVTFVSGINMPQLNTNVYAEITYDENLFEISEEGVLLKYKGTDTDVVIPDGVTAIGDNVFSGYRRLTSIEIPESVTSIGVGAFQNCSRLISIEIPESVTSIGDRVFRNCSSLTSIKIPKGVTSIGALAFYGCSCLTSIEIPESITSIGESAFSNCSRLKSIEIPKNITIIPSGMLQSCSALTNIEIPEGVTSIGEYAFSDCSALTNIEIPEGVTSIGEYAFSDCSGLTSIEIPKSVTSIGSSAFRNCSSLNTIQVVKENTVYDSRNNCNAIIKTEANELIFGCKNTVVPNDITSIGEYAFSRCNRLTSIKIPESVTSVGVGAFQDCSRLKSIEIPESVTSIEDWVFRNCSKLTSIKIPKGVTRIGAFAFNGCSGLTSIEIPENVTSIGEYAFSNCSKLTSIKIPKSVTNIGGNAFSYCSGLTAVEIPESITIIPYGMLQSCSALTSIEIPETVTEISEYAFSGCSSLAAIEIPETVQTIRNGAFSYCSSLKSIHIPRNLLKIESDVFSSCDELTTITVDEHNLMYDSRNNCNAIFEKFTDNNRLIAGCNNTKIPEETKEICEYAFSGCSKLTNIEIPENVTSIGNFAFQNCSSLTSIEIPEKVTSIGVSAFDASEKLEKITVSEKNTVYDSRNNCNALIETATNKLIVGCNNTNIPEGITSIGSHAFSRCNKLTSIEIPASVTSIGSSVFNKCEKLEKITVSEKNTVYDSRNNCNAVIKTAANELVVGCKNTNIPESVVSIGKDAFSYCNDLTSIEIPENVTAIEASAFKGCEKLEKITVSEKNTAYDSRNNCNAIIETATNILVVGSNNTVIPNDVMTIGSSAFYGRSIKRIEIPESITNIESDVFFYVTDLEEIIVYNDKLKLSVMSKIANTVTIIANKGSEAEAFAIQNGNPFKELNASSDENETVILPEKIETEKVITKEELDGYVQEKLKKALEEIIDEIFEVIAQAAPKLNTDIFAAMFENDKKMSVGVTDEENNLMYEWTFDSQKQADVNESIDLNVEISKDNDEAKEIAEVIGTDEIISMSCSYKGKLPAKANFKAYVGNKFADEKQVYLYRHAKKAKGTSIKALNEEIMLVNAEPYIVKNGYVNVLIEEGADYFLSTQLIEDNTSTVTDGAVEITGGANKPDDSTADTNKPDNNTGTDNLGVSLYGDADENGKVDLNDAKLVLKLALGINAKVTEKGKLNADYDANNKIDLNDAKFVLKEALGIKVNVDRK